MLPCELLEAHCATVSPGTGRPGSALVYGCRANMIDQILIASFCVRLGALVRYTYRKSIPAFSSSAFVEISIIY